MEDWVERRRGVLGGLSEECGSPEDGWFGFSALQGYRAFFR
jgi:hypothetical protein